MKVRTPRRRKGRLYRVERWLGGRPRRRAPREGGGRGAPRGRRREPGAGEDRAGAVVCGNVKPQARPLQTVN